MRWLILALIPALAGCVHHLPSGACEIFTHDSNYGFVRTHAEVHHAELAPSGHLTIREASWHVIFFGKWGWWDDLHGLSIRPDKVPKQPKPARWKQHRE